jgi:CRP/FNR family transcriptional regulator, cyclic AMP receptor protein
MQLSQRFPGLSLEGHLERKQPGRGAMAKSAFDFDLLVRGGFPLERFEEGSRIFVQDDAGNCMYVVRSGKVGIVANGAILETVEPNGTFGEMALIDGSPRSATAIAREATEVAVINERAFLYLIEKNPGFALDLMRLLTRRLRRTTENL